MFSRGRRIQAQALIGSCKPCLPALGLGATVTSILLAAQWQAKSALAAAQQAGRLSDKGHVVVANDGKGPVVICSCNLMEEAPVAMGAPG